MIIKTKNVIFIRTRCAASMQWEKSREYVEEAIKEGFEVIGFSDHSPYLFKNGYVSRIRMTMSQLEDYVKTIEALKKEYRDDITIFLALEMEYFPGIFEPTIEKIRQYPMDYLLLAQHFSMKMKVLSV